MPLFETQRKGAFYRIIFDSCCAVKNVFWTSELAQQVSLLLGETQVPRDLLALVDASHVHTCRQKYSYTHVHKIKTNTYEK